MDIDHFIRERKPAWTRLAELLDAFERANEWDMGHERIKELVTLYRQACTDLNQARTYTANPELLDTLNQITGRAYRLVYSEGGRAPLRETFWRFVSVQIPETFQKEVRYILLALVPFAAGVLFGFAVVKVNPASAEAFLPAMFFSASPKERVMEIESNTERIDSSGRALAFGSQLYIHNIGVTLLAFSLSALTLVGGMYVLFNNGMMLGIVACMYHNDGVAKFFYAWVGPHGALEIPAMIFGAAAGFRFAQAVLMPGNLSRKTAIRDAFPSVYRMLCMVVAMLIVCGLIEGSFSQFSSKTVSYDIKIGVAIALFVSLNAYLFGTRRGHDELKGGAA